MNQEIRSADWPSPTCNPSGRRVAGEPGGRVGVVGGVLSAVGADPLVLGDDQPIRLQRVACACVRIAACSPCSIWAGLAW